MPRYRANQEKKLEVDHSAEKRSAQGAPYITDGLSGHLKPEPGEIHAFCPKCGSPYIASFEPGESKHLGAGELRLPRFDPGKTEQATDGNGELLWVTKAIPQALPDFSCTAGDCGHVGVASRVP